RLRYSWHQRSRSSEGEKENPFNVGRPPFKRISRLQRLHCTRSQGSHGPGYDLHRSLQAAVQGFYPSDQKVHKAGSQRVPEDRNGHGHWLCHHGLHWFLREANTHPHQQHHLVPKHHERPHRADLYHIA
ncbi:unnamed protein product, partial [Ixodes hexagonus]